MEKQKLLALAEVIRREKQDYANDAERIGKMLEDIINSIPLSVALPKLNSLNTFENRGMYVVNLQSTDDGIVIGVLDVFGAWNSDYTTQRFVTNASLDSLNAGDAVPIMNGSETHVYDRHYSSISETWTQWEEPGLKLDDSVITSWGGIIVENPKINSQRSIANGKVVLAKMDDGKMGFVWEVTDSDGTKSYYNNWVEGSNHSAYKNYQDTPFDGTKQVEIKRTIFLTPDNGTYLCLNGKEVANISSGISAGSGTLLLGDINSLTDNSASSQIATALNNKTLAELQDAVRNGASIQFVGDYGVVDIIHKDQSSGQLVFGFIYTDEPVYAPYMSKIIALEYTNGNWTCKVREDVNLSSGGSGGGSGIMVVNDLGALKTSSTDAEIKDILSPYTFDDILAGIKNGKLLVGVNKDSGWASVYQCPQWTEELIILVSNNLVLKAVGIHKEPDGSLEVATAEEDIPMLSSQIANSLTTIDDGYVLDARQGKVLADRIAALEVAVAALQNK